MPTPASVTYKTVHGQITALDGSGTPAVGHVVFRSPGPIRDIADNVVFGPTAVKAELDDNGEFTVTLAATNDADLDPTGWTWEATVKTDALNATFHIPVDEAGPTPIEFADVITTTAPPGFNFYTTAEVDALLALKVDKAGDTMTGDLTIDAGLQVTGDADVEGALTTQYTSAPINVGQMLTIQASTAIISGGEITPNADPTKIDISALFGYIVTYVSWLPLSPTNPTLSLVSLAAQIGLTPAFAPITWYRVNPLGVLAQQATRPTPEQRRANLIIGATATTGLGTTVIVDQTLPVIPAQVGNQLVDLMDALGPFGVTGNVLSANGANLTFDKTVGDIFARAFSYVPDFQDPHNATLAAQTPVQFRHITALPGSAGALTSTLDVANYDLNGAGVVTSVPGGANAATNFRVWGFANNGVTEQILVQYGQQSYSSLTAAVESIPAGGYVPNPSTNTAAPIGWISVIHTATDLSDPDQAVFTPFDAFA